MASEIEVRQPNSEEEIGALLRIRYEMLEGPSGRLEAFDLSAIDRLPGVAVYIALQEEEVVGTGRLVPADEEGVFLVQRVAALNPGRGVGRILMKHMEAEAKAAGATRVELYTAEGDAERFYCMLGYSLKYPGAQGRTKLMAKDLINGREA